MKRPCEELYVLNSSSHGLFKNVLFYLFLNLCWDFLFFNRFSILWDTDGQSIVYSVNLLFLRDIV